jgi:hypothetical protein
MAPGDIRPAFPLLIDCVLCEVSTGAEERVEYRAYNTEWHKQMAVLQHMAIMLHLVLKIN